METPPSVRATDMPEVETRVVVNVTRVEVVVPFFYLAAYSC